MKICSAATSSVRRRGLRTLGLLGLALAVAFMLPAVALAAPVTTASPSPAASAPGPITVWLTPSGGTAPYTTYYWLGASGDAQLYNATTGIVLGTPGIYDLYFFSVDHDGIPEPQIDYQRLHVGNGAWSWQASGSATYWGASFANGSTGWVVGVDGTAPALLATTDGGSHWAAQNPGVGSTNAVLSGVCARDANLAWAVGYDNSAATSLIQATTDGGAAWSSQRATSQEKLYGVSFPDASHGWAVGQDDNTGTALVLATTDGGATWSGQNAGTAEADGAWLNAVCGIDTTHAWAAGTDGAGRPAIFATTNGGADWAAQTTGTTHSGTLWGVSFADAGHGWTVGQDWDTGAPIILVTTDGGAHWTAQSQTAVTAGELGSVSFADTQHGWAVGQDQDRTDGTTPALILVTSDGGSTWIAQDSGSDAPLHAVSYPGTSHVWVAGGNGFIASASSGTPIGYTPVGAPSNVDLGGGITLSFATVTADGITATSTTPAGANDAIGGYTVIGGVYRTFSTTATFSGAVQITLPYSPTGLTAGQQAALRVYHEQGGGWVNVTTSVDTGAHLIHCSVTDLSGRFAVAADMTKPVTGTPGFQSGWHRSAVTLTLDPTDALGSGVQSTQYSLDSGATWVAGTSVVFDIWRRGGGDGSHVVQYRSIDVAGNTEDTKTVTVMIDHAAPTVTSDAPSAPVVGPQTVHLHPTDTGSGIASTSWKLDNGSWTDHAGSGDVTVAVAGVGIHWIYCYATDTAGNVGTLRLFSVTITSAGASAAKTVRPPTKVGPTRIAPPHRAKRR